MKKFLLISSFMFLVSCKRPWSEKDKADFVSGCLAGGAVKDLGETRAKNYCNCMLTKVMTRYPNRNDALFMQHDSSMTAIGKDCLKQP